MSEEPVIDAPENASYVELNAAYLAASRYSAQLRLEADHWRRIGEGLYARAEQAHADLMRSQMESQESPVFERLPMSINLGDFGITSHLGWASAIKNDVTGETRLEIRMSKEATEKLGDMVELFDLKGIGFAGIKRKAQHEQ